SPAPLCPPPATLGMPPASKTFIKQALRYANHIRAKGKGPRANVAPCSYSYRSASIGSRREARMAGTMPKNTPTVAEKPKPIAKDHQGSETGKPVSQLTSRAI